MPLSRQIVHLKLLMLRRAQAVSKHAPLKAFFETPLARPSE